MSQTQKLYIITRQDLTPAYQAVQSCHVVADVILKHPKYALEWHRTSNTMVMLSVKDEFSLLDIEDKLKENGFKFASFREPDLNGELTAIAIIPGEGVREFCKGFSLALKNVSGAGPGSAGLSKSLSIAGSNPARNAK